MDVKSMQVAVVYISEVIKVVTEVPKKKKKKKKTIHADITIITNTKFQCRREIGIEQVEHLYLEVRKKAHVRKQKFKAMLFFIKNIYYTHTETHIHITVCLIPFCRQINSVRERRRKVQVATVDLFREKRRHSKCAFHVRRGRGGWRVAGGGRRGGREADVDVEGPDDPSKTLAEYPVFKAVLEESRCSKRLVDAFLGCSVVSRMFGE
jgi:hypothetical protein